MSHIKVLDCEFKDVGVLGRTCEKRQIPFEAAEAGKTLTRKLYEGTVRGLAAFRLKGWKYDAVVQKDGTCKADNYNGAWGDPAELDALKQGYALQSAREKLGRNRFRVQSETTNQEGTVELVFVG